MQELLIFLVGEYLFAVNRELVVAATETDSGNIKTIHNDGVEYLPLNKQRAAKVIRLEEVFSNAAGPAKNRRFIVVELEREYLALAVTGRSSVASIMSDGLIALPPIYSPQQRKLFPAMLVNGGQGILMLSPQELKNMERPFTA